MKTKKLFQYILSIVTVLMILVLIIINTPNSSLDLSLYKPYISHIFMGFLWTLFISILIFILSLLLGLLLFFTQKSKFHYIRFLTNHLTTIMFGSPMLVVVIVFYFFIGTAIGINSKLFLGIISLSLYFGPFMMKLYISAFEGIEKNQFIVCDLFGFSKFQMYRYVIFPQMFKIMLPPLSGQLATIIKSSSLLYLIGFNELYYNLTTVQAKTFAYTEGYIIMMGLYLIITVPLCKLTDYLEESIKI